MKGLRKISVLSLVVIGALLLSVFGTAIVQGADEDYIISKYSDYSEQNREFLQTVDTIYMKIWSSIVGDDPKTKKWLIVDSAGNRESGSLTADGYSDGGTLTFVASTPASLYAVGDATLTMQLQSGKNKYKVTETIAILGSGNQPPPAPSWIEPDVTNDNTPDIYWESVTDPNGDTVYYYIKIGTTSDGSEILPETSTGTDSYYNVTTPMNDGTYYVNVKSYDGELYSSWHEETMVITSSDMWTFMVYLDGDNSLTDQTTDDLNEMQSVGSTDLVNIVVLEDKLGSGDTKAYYVNYGSLNEIPLSNIDASWTDEVNMGDSNTLSAFANYMIDSYPALHYILSIWDHGNGYLGVSFDDTSDDYLTMDEVETALTDIKAANGNNNLDILGYDACIMGMIEVSYEIDGLIDYFVASEENVPWDGWPYDDILGHLTDDPTMSPAALSTVIVEDYIASYSGFNYITMSALDMSKLPDLITVTDDFALILIDKVPTQYDKIQRSRRNTDNFGGCSNYDLYGFAENIRKNIRNDKTLRDAALDVMNAVDAAVIAEGHGSGHRKAHGVAIYFPEDFYPETHPHRYLDFANDTNWDEFLDVYVGYE